MSAGRWRSAEEAADELPSRWRTNDVRRVRDFAGGLHANVFANEPGETSAPPLEGAILAFILQGERRHRLWMDGRAIIDGLLRPGDLWGIPAGLTPRAVVVDRVRVLHVYAPTEVLNRVGETATGRERQIELVNPNLAEDPQLSGPMLLLANALDHGRQPGRLWLDGVGLAISSRVVERWSNISEDTARRDKPNGGLAPWQLRRACERMTDDLAAEPGLAELAGLVRLSPEHFCRAFRASTGLPPHRWLAERRMEQAKALLLDDRLSLTDVAQMVGYSGQSAFGAAFRRAAGWTPSAWRRERMS